MKLNRQQKEAAPRPVLSARQADVIVAQFRKVVDRALTMRRRQDLSFDQVWESTFFTSYVIGFPSYLESHGEEQMLFVRKALLEACFDEDWDQIMIRFRKAMQQIKLRHGGAFEGWRLGDMDGKDYFKTMFHGASGNDLLANLRMSVKRQEQFEPL